MSNTYKKIKYYIQRYMVAEIAGTICAILAAGIFYYFTGSKAAAAIAGTWGENGGFYGAILLRDMGELRKEDRSKTIGGHFRNIFLEFGLSEVADSFFVRPASMFIFALFIPSIAIATVLGKITADVIFYGIAIFSREYRISKKSKTKSDHSSR